MADNRDTWATVLSAARLYALDTNSAAYSTIDANALILGNRIYRSINAREPRVVTHSGTTTAWTISAGGTDCLSDASLTVNYSRWLHVFVSTTSAAAATLGAKRVEIVDMGKILTELE